ncbi:PQQ-binding-like beta-propeller repeat protein [Paenibacillus tuaregi]|uniref:hypothetical protein n=1 Tax=Paenibacillus tuaregi TaxID=1816681 RepID=UPI000838A256|nr:hypothetical protein [Paenibacillus tuaregi]
MSRQRLWGGRLTGKFMICLLVAVVAAGTASAEGERHNIFEAAGLGPGIRITDVQLTRNVQYTLGGITSEKHGYIALANKEGDIIWSKDVEISEDDKQIQFTSVQSDVQGAYFLGGSQPGRSQYYADLYFTKLDNSGAVKWKKVVETGGFGYVYSVAPVSDGGMVYTAVSSQNGQSQDAYIGRLNKKGESVWTKVISSSGSDPEGVTAESIYPSAGGSFLVGGSQNGRCSVWKLDSAGKMVWSKNFKGASSGRVIASKDGGGIAALVSRTGEGRLVKLGRAGGEEWSQPFKAKAILSLELSQDGGYLLGTSEGIVKFNHQGEVQGTSNIRKVTGLYKTAGTAMVAVRSLNRLEKLSLGSFTSLKSDRNLPKLQPKVADKLQFDSEEYSISSGDTFDTVVLSSRSGNGRRVPVTKLSKFQSDNPKVLTIDNEGNITGVKRGKTVIRASYEGQSVAAEVSVY